MRNFLLTVWVLTAVVLSAQAQPLAEHVPADAVAYFGWRGADDPGPKYDGSNLQALAASTDLPAVVGQVLNAVEQASPRNPQVAMVTGLIRTIGSASWKHPTAVYVQPVDNPEMPVRCVVLWHAPGETGDALIRSLDEMLMQLPPNAPLMPGRSGDLVRLSIGPPDEQPGQPDARIGDNPLFAQSLRQVDPDGVLIAYLDAQALLSIIDRQVARDASPNEQATWIKVRDALGLAGLNAVVGSCGFDGKDWRTDLFIDAPAPRTGVLSLLDGEPIGDAELAAVPAEANWFAAVRFDLAALLDEARRVIEAIDPQTLAHFNDAIMQGSAMTGVDLEADLIRSLGSAWIIYIDPGATGGGMMGMCLVNPLKDADKAHQALISLQALANALMSQAAANPHGPAMYVRFQASEHEGMTLHTLSVPFVAPTWSIHEGRLYVGLYPQVVMTAGDRARSGGSILDNDKYRAVRDRLGGHEATSIVYSDLPATAQGSYANLVMLTQLGTGMLSMFSAEPTPLLLPPFKRVEPLLSPCGQVAWSDDSGYHSRSISPFPGASMLGNQGGNMMTMSGPMLIGITLPALGAARRSAMQVQSMSNVRQLNLGLLVYATDHKDALPTDIYEVFKQGYIDNPTVFVSRASGKQPPGNFHQLDEQQQAQWVRQNSSYILVPTLKLDGVGEAWRWICLIELPQDASNPDMIAVGFLDGHAESMPAWDAIEMVEDQSGMTFDQLIQRQQNYQPQPLQPQQAPGSPPAP